MSVSAEVSFALPGTWWRIPLREEQETSAAIRAYVEATIGRSDERAQARHDLRNHLTSATDEARRGWGRDMFLATEIAPGVPLAVTLTTYHPPLPERLSDSGSMQERADAFAGTLREPGSQAEIDVWVGDGIAAIREVDLDPMTGAGGEQEFNLRAKYWLLNQGESAAMLFTFSTPLIWREQADPVVELFDAIIETADWAAAAGEV